MRKPCRACRLGACRRHAGKGGRGSTLLGGRKQGMQGMHGAAGACRWGMPAHALGHAGPCKRHACMPGACRWACRSMQVHAVGMQGACRWGMQGHACMPPWHAVHASEWGVACRLRGMPCRRHACMARHEHACLMCMARACRMGMQGHAHKSVPRACTCMAQALMHSFRMPLHAAPCRRYCPHGLIH
jgi:hypothetical protein